MEQNFLIQVTVLTQEHCGFCEAAQVMLARLAQVYPLQVTTIDLESPAGQEMAMQGGILFPPGIFLNGVSCCYGRPSERKLRREFDRLRDGMLAHRAAL